MYGYFDAGAVEKIGAGEPEEPHHLIGIGVMDMMPPAGASGEDAQIRRFVEAHFDEPFLKNFSMEEHVGFFRGLHESLPGLDVEQVQKPSPFSVEFVLVSRQTGHRGKGDFELQPQPPHRIIGLGFEPGEG